jgi:hypothetical protein
MIETETLTHRAHELAEFVNGHTQPHPLFTAEDAEEEESFLAHRPPEEPRTPKQTDALRKRARACLVALAKVKRGKTVNAKLARLARAWLEDDLVRDTHSAHSYTQMDGVLSLSESGQLQVAHTRFRSIDAQHAVTFAELIQPAPKGKKKKGPPFIKHCITCGDFFVLPPLRQRPWSHCPRHRQEIQQTKRTPKGESQ